MKEVHGRCFLRFQAPHAPLPISAHPRMLRFCERPWTKQSKRSVGTSIYPSSTATAAELPNGHALLSLLIYLYLLFSRQFFHLITFSISNRKRDRKHRSCSPSLLIFFIAYRADSSFLMDHRKDRPAPAAIRCRHHIDCGRVRRITIGRFIWLLWLLWNIWLLRIRRLLWLFRIRNHDKDWNSPLFRYPLIVEAPDAGRLKLVRMLYVPGCVHGSVKTT